MFTVINAAKKMGRKPHVLMKSLRLLLAISCLQLVIDASRARLRI